MSICAVKGGAKIDVAIWPVSEIGQARIEGDKNPYGT